MQLIALKNYYSKFSLQKFIKKGWDTTKHMKATSILTTKKYELTTNNFDY
ncbi:conserved hypothetical protein [Priestia megaterium]|uniref:Uncharacterized protein n=1 Tax=Priestia megaterium (strain ATCC 12872 / QMB1551) TaxID=545693 RepID=D5E1D6_PRIM1|nr:hypothetical protein BMQ_1454 [Priestia megaterium QM B1551]QLK07679.1 hypothetical protein BMG_4235 [Priestia megaterium]